MRLPASERADAQYATASDSHPPRFVHAIFHAAGHDPGMAAQVQQSRANRHGRPRRETGHGANRGSWRVHDAHRAHPGRRRRTAEWCGGAREDRREAPVPRPAGPESGRGLSAFDRGPRELTMAMTPGTSADVNTLPGCRLRRVTEYIEQNLDKELRLAELAALAYMSPYHFARLFKCSTGVPPHRFVVRQRVARASAFLATPDLAIAQIARMVGFRTPSHFTTVFRRVTGVTPRGYRTDVVRENRPGREGA